MDDDQLLRYSRHVLLPQIDIEGQEKLLSGRILIVGLGGLGSPAAMYLASAGIGQLILCDDDIVDLTNLQRQILHSTKDIGRKKTESAQSVLQAMNPDLTYEWIDRRLGEPELESVVHGVDLVLDCSDNLATRFMINRVCVRTGTALVSGAVIRFEGQIAVFDPASQDSPCYNCLYQDLGESTDSCSRNGVVAPLPGVIGSMQALEAIKYLVNPAAAQTGQLLIFDAWRLEWNRLRLRRNPDCPTCGRMN
ncbi:MAG TPA: molybdopterin-synthase adenylyltransferase MoeB [Methylococcaceae bacterium]|jgi:adenylyltransferase/sulfurtransferase|nr:molybdopterin-synthase adenylyltransferase MoeB [Methylococcaceae bacterium]